MFALPLALALQGAAATPPMPPPSSPVEESRFGVTLHDPYRGLENLKDPAVAGWIRAQSDYTRGLLDSIPQRAAVLADIQRLERATPSQLVDAVLMPGDRILLQRRSAGAESASLYLRQADGGEQVLLEGRDRRGHDRVASKKKAFYLIALAWAFEAATRPNAGVARSSLVSRGAQSAPGGSGAFDHWPFSATLPERNHHPCCIPAAASKIAATPSHCSGARR